MFIEKKCGVSIRPRRGRTTKAYISVIGCLLIWAGGTVCFRLPVSSGNGLVTQTANGTANGKSYTRNVNNSNVATRVLYCRIGEGEI